MKIWYKSIKISALFGVMADIMMILFTIYVTNDYVLRMISYDGKLE